MEKNLLNRREFLSLSTLGATALAAGFPKLMGQTPKKKWYKGNLHTHNQWSDGKLMPEMAMDWYKSRGYQFLCPSDHNIFAGSDLRFDTFYYNSKPTDEEKKQFDGETSFWKLLTNEEGWPKLGQRALSECIEKFGEDSIQKKKIGDRTFVRMKTFDELVEQFAEPEKFLLIPGFEQTGSVQWESRDLHMNFINVRTVFPYIRGETPFDGLRRTFTEGEQRFAGQDYLFTANHPMWRYYDYSPSDLIQLPQIRIFEILNNSVASGYQWNKDAWTPEKFWDVVNAFRASHDQLLLFGMGSDDKHDYDIPNPRWSVVRAEKLEIASLLAAIREGDMYASTGLDFEDISFDGRTLTVKINVHEEGIYKIEFFGTKKDYDPSFKMVRTEKTQTSPARTIELYSDQIGICLDTIEGTEGSYTLKPDDLYVRAKITKTNSKKESGWRDNPAAWTQPYRR